MDQWLGTGAVRRADHGEPRGVSRRGRARGRVPVGAARIGPRRSSRSATATASTPPTNAWSSRRSSGIPDVEAVYSPAAATPRPSRPSRSWGGCAGSSSPTTSTPTTGGCCATAGSRWCCTTTCAPTRGWRCGSILQQHGALPGEPARPAPIQVDHPVQPAGVTRLNRRFAANPGYHFAPRRRRRADCRPGDRSVPPELVNGVTVLGNLAIDVINGAPRSPWRLRVVRRRGTAGCRRSRSASWRWAPNEDHALFDPLLERFGDAGPNPAL